MALAYPVPIPFASLLGVTLLEMKDGTARLGCDAHATLRNSYGGAHGGLLMTLLDLAMVHAARSPREGEAQPPLRCVTIDMSTSFLRAGSGFLVARAKVVSRSKRLAFCEATVFDAEEQMLARAHGTFHLAEDR